MDAIGQHKNMLIAFGSVLAVFLIARKLVRVQHDPREPPIIKHQIPFFGHVIGMFRYGGSYFDIIHHKYNCPIYTLPTLTGRTYIITSPSLAAQIQRSSKSTSFYSAILEVTRRICAFDKASMDIIWNNVNRDDGEHGLMPESHDMLANVLGPGRILNGMTKLQLENFTDTFEKLSFGIGGQEGKEVDLLDWCRQQFTLANARAIYGPENIFDMHSELVEDFWVFEQGLIGLLADVLPVITARKAHLARRRIIAALVEYVEKESYKKASPMIQHRVAINLKNGITKEMTGHGEMIMMFAILGNAVPTTFWFLANLFSKPKLLQEVRDEIKNAIEVTNKAETGAGVEIRTIHVDMLKAGAPVLVSSFRETLRMVANLTSVRWILEDTIIGDKYLLKKDSIVQVASGVVHMDKETWGAEAAMFNPKRFIITSTETSTPTTVPLPNNVPSAAFRAFGGGSVICPGRHFAQSEIVGFVAAFVMGFDMEKPGGEAFELPARNNEAIPLAVMKPTTSCRVIIKKRQGLENVKWNLDL